MGVLELTSYVTFVGVAVVVIVAPGADFAVVTRNTLAGGRRQGWATAWGINLSNLVQGTAAAAGIGALIVASTTLFTAIKVVGAGYLALLAVQALRSALRGQYDDSSSGSASRGFRQGVLTNITNPKVLIFYLAVLPQFISPGAPVLALMLLAVTHALISQVYLSLLVAMLDRSRHWLTRRSVRRVLDALTATAFGAFGIRLLSA